MSTVTQFIKKAKQPRGGYAPMSKVVMSNMNDDDLELSLIDENLHASVIGMAVDYMTRFVMGDVRIVDAFHISLSGAEVLDLLYGSGCFDFALGLCYIIDSDGGCLSDDSIIAACRLVSFDCAYRSEAALMSFDFESINRIPDDETIEHIRAMVKRSMSFFESYGPVVDSGMTFEGGYTSVLTKGDADFMTEDTLWDFKVSNAKPTSKHMLQLLCYYLLGLNSDEPSAYQKLKYLGVYNPRLDRVYRIKISDIPCDNMGSVCEMIDIDESILDL